MPIQRLSEEIVGFNMDKFVEQVVQRKDQIDEQIMDLLLSFSDFESFKEMMLFNRAHVVATTPKIKSGKAAALGLKDNSQQPSASGYSSGDAASQKMREEELKHFEQNIDKLQISGEHKVVHEDEEEEGEARPDLNLDIIKV